jgi:hypothetical protein
MSNLIRITDYAIGPQATVSIHAIKYVYHTVILLEETSLVKYIYIYIYI